jgi:hypothetical protein
VFACGRCSDESKRFVGWLSKPAPQAQGQDVPVTEGELIRRPQDLKWVRSDSREGEQIIREVRGRCTAAGVRINYCHPEPDRRR